ncbi:SDR family NAD(P)-dependent oxidoreductase [Reyranella sp. CPCC 100927]|uniref:SDR family NAD(P)-dependent oxidoreductase n=1 Tax=Reyranella sp. CPCC 100927 TaxID=2599616 RepID=UPI0011B7DCF3|nr:SDR family NAD(P)-dependent oxidoreductase [Reyranella sp. CPCC 100927]TWT14990.1 SDR family NAD(P)-dependent oxidoreductase [Reyranella sp. CPCC 100927]
MASRDTWLILGASSALARAFARRAAREGARLLLAGRDTADLADGAADLRTRFAADVDIVAFDAVAPQTHAAVAARLASAERPNVLLAFAAMPMQAEMESKPALAAVTLDANLTGAATILLRLLPVLEAKRGARVVIVGSVAGDRGRPRNYVYGASKAGLHALASGYRGRLHRAGVSVSLVKAGPFDSAMTFTRTGLRGVATAEAVADDCWRAAHRRATVVYSPATWRWIMMAVKAVPEPLFKRLDV